MDKDAAISVGVRLDTAIFALKEALEHVGASAEADPEALLTTADEVREGVEEALQSLSTARALVRSVSGH